MITVKRITCQEFQLRNKTVETLLELNRRQRFECCAHYDACAGCQFFVAMEDMECILINVSIEKFVELQSDKVIIARSGGLGVGKEEPRGEKA